MTFRRRTTSSRIPIGNFPVRAVAMLSLAALGGFAPLIAQQPVAAAASGRTLSLQQAYVQAEVQSPSVRIARAQLERAHGQEWQARSQYLPQLNAQFLYTKTLASQFSALTGAPDNRPLCQKFLPPAGATTSQRLDTLETAVGLATNCRAAGGLDFSKAGFGAANQWQLGLAASVNLFTGGRVTAINRVASAGYRAAEFEVRSQRAQLAVNVAQAYFDAVLADRLLAIAESSLVQTEAVFRQVKLSNAVGNSAEFELLRAQVTRDNQRPQLIQRHADRDVARLRLKQVLNLAPADSFVLSTSPNDEDPAVLQSLLVSLGAATSDTSTVSRTLVKQAAEAVSVQEDQFRVARSQQLPTVTLASSYGRVAFSQQDFQVPNLNSFLTNWTVSLTASLPLFTGGRIYGDEMVARASVTEAQARLDQARQGAAIDVRQTMAQLDQAVAAWQASAGTSEQAGKAYRIAEVRYREGISTQIELNDSRLLLQQTQANRASAARNLQLARLRVSLVRDLPLGAASGGAFGSGQGQSQQQQASPQGGQGAGSQATAGQQSSAGTSP